MLLITILSIFFLLCYIALIFTYILGWKRLKPYALTEEKQVATSVAIIIPARNESERISACLQSIFHQNYPTDLLEIIVIDDYSTDGTAQIVEEWCGKMEHLRLIRLADELPKGARLNSYKKKAIEIAISKTQQQLIVTTDADCLMKPNWLCTLVNFYEEFRPKLMTAPVFFTKETSFFQRFQSLDFAGMMVSTGASVHLNLSNMCNGANLTYERAVFEEVGGFRGIDDIASGDDMLLMHKVWKKYPKKVRFVKSYEATVFSYAQKTVSDFAQQRIRWASKSTKYEDTRITFFLAAVYLFHISLLLNLLLSIFISTAFLPLLIFSLSAKMLTDFVFLAIGCQFFKRTKLLWLFLPAQLVHILYILIIGAWGNFGSYEWKGRQVK
ncbi:MAG: glycosyltransferase [Chitinophagales bacterium]